MKTGDHVRVLVDADGGTGALRQGEVCGVFDDGSIEVRFTDGEFIEWAIFDPHELEPAAPTPAPRTGDRER